MNVKKFAQNHDLSKRLDARALNALSLDELQSLKKILIDRAAAVVGAIGALEARDEFERVQSERLMFCAEEKDERDERLFYYSPDPRMESENLFVPGAWFKHYLDRLETLRELKAANAETYEQRNKNKLIGELLGTKAAAVAA